MVIRRKASSEPVVIGEGEEEVKFYILSPSAYVKSNKDKTEAERKEAIHAECMVLRLMFRDLGVLFPGDSNRACWERIVKHYDKLLSSKLLLASHHGSRSFFKNNKDDEEQYDEHLNLIKPGKLVISVSHPSKHEHPHDDAIDVYKKVVSEKEIYITETEDIIQCLVYRVYKEKDGKWFFSFNPNTALAADYLFSEKSDEDEESNGTPFVKIGAKICSNEDGEYQRRIFVEWKTASQKDVD